MAAVMYCKTGAEAIAKPRLAMLTFLIVVTTLFLAPSNTWPSNTLASASFFPLSPPPAAVPEQQRLAARSTGIGTPHGRTARVARAGLSRAGAPQRSTEERGPARAARRSIIAMRWTVRWTV